MKRLDFLKVALTALAGATLPTKKLEKTDLLIRGASVSVHDNKVYLYRQYSMGFRVTQELMDDAVDFKSMMDFHIDTMAAEMKDMVGRDVTGNRKFVCKLEDFTTRGFGNVQESSRLG